MKVEQKYEDVNETTYQWLLQMREKSMVMCRSLRVWFVRKQCDLQIYSTNWILRHPKDDLLDGKIVMD